MQTPRSELLPIFQKTLAMFMLGQKSADLVTVEASDGGQVTVQLLRVRVFIRFSLM